VVTLPGLGAADEAPAVGRRCAGETSDANRRPASTQIGPDGSSAAAESPPAGVGEQAALLSRARHLAIRAEVRRLLRVWADAGIECLLFKGFHHAEFTYPNPGARVYSDVDILLRPEDALLACRLAGGAGWRELWHAQKPSTVHSIRGPGYNGHEVALLRSDRTGVQLDVHRHLVHHNHNRMKSSGRQERITRLGWQSSQVIDWEGIPVRQLDPLDAVLVGLVLNRCWSPEDFALREHDDLDFRLLVERNELDEGALRRRARELGCERTYALFLERCDPFRGKLNLGPVSRLELQRLNMLVRRERGNRYLDMALMAATRSIETPLDIVREFPGVVSVVLLSARAGDVRTAANRFGPAESPGRSLDADAWRRIRRAVHRGLRLLGRGTLRHRDLEAVALLAALRRRSVAAGLAWPVDGGPPSLELDGRPLNMSGTLLKS
jgi:hypothetical protein